MDIYFLNKVKIVVHFVDISIPLGFWKVSFSAKKFYDENDDENRLAVDDCVNVRKINKNTYMTLLLNNNLK